MKKILLIGLLLFMVCICNSCSNSDENSGTQVTISESDFFIVDVHYEEKYFNNRLGQYWIIDIKPKNNLYRFEGLKYMDVTILYTGTRQDNGKFESGNYHFVEVEYDENGYGHKEEAVYGAGNIQDIKLLSYEFDACKYDYAYKK